MKLKDFFVAIGAQVDEAQFQRADRAVGKLEERFGALGEAWAKIPERIKEYAIGNVIANVVLEAVETVGSAIEELSKRFLEAGNETAELSVKMGDLASEMGASVEQVSRLKYAADATGVEFGTVGAAAVRLSRNALEVTRGNYQAALSFNQLGVSIRDAAGRMKQPEALFLDTIEALGKMKDKTTANGIAMQLMGRGIDGLLPLIRRGKEELQRLGDEGERVGAVITDDMYQQGLKWEESMARMRGAATGLTYAIGGGLIPLIIRGADAIADWVIANKGWLSNDSHTIVLALAGAFKTLALVGPDLGAAFHVVAGAATVFFQALDLLLRVLRPFAPVLKPLLTGLLTLRLFMLFAGAAQALLLKGMPFLFRGLARLAFGYREVAHEEKRAADEAERFNRVAGKLPGLLGKMGGLGALGGKGSAGSLLEDALAYKVVKGEKAGAAAEAEGVEVAAGGGLLAKLGFLGELLAGTAALVGLGALHKEMDALADYNAGKRSAFGHRRAEDPRIGFRKFFELLVYGTGNNGDGRNVLGAPIHALSHEEALQEHFPIVESSHVAAPLLSVENGAIVQHFHLPAGSDARRFADEARKAVRAELDSRWRDARDRLVRTDRRLP